MPRKMAGEGMKIIVNERMVRGDDSLVDMNAASQAKTREIDTHFRMQKEKRFA